MADTFADGKASDFDAVVCTTGFRLDHPWIDVPGTKDEEGRIQHERGVTPASHFMLGLPWQHASLRPAWMGDQDAEFLAERMSAIDSSTTASGAR